MKQYANYFMIMLDSCDTKICKKIKKKHKNSFNVFHHNNKPIVPLYHDCELDDCDWCYGYDGCLIGCECPRCIGINKSIASFYRERENIIKGNYDLRQDKN